MNKILMHIDIDIGKAARFLVCYVEGWPKGDL